MSATTKHSSEGAGSVSGKAPPMLKSDDARERILGHIPRYDSREDFKAEARTPELCTCSSVALALDDVGSVDGEVLGTRVPR
ncbi:hypothetical protein F511_40974 [Dorcoceras hygrometricum]|uniref:Uncharacterized protein n=1 Tax=Dorcoceras hygrometricum TaxID=472368 RepID=A0A2Z7C836_9LAMI|nr:hypothetical protein F511_40974 [Dorcoceras hygrometricum]